MLAATRSELIRLRRKGVMIGWLGLMALFAVLINMVVFQAATGGTAAPGNGPGVTFPSLAALSGPSGPVAGLGAASSMFGVVTLAFWAVVTATDYSTGLIRLLASAQPRRLLLMTGKVAALTIWTAAATSMALLVNVLVAPAAARAAGVSTAAWGADLVPILASGWANAFAAMVVWGVIGLVLATVTRSSAVAISAGVGYVLVVEMILRTVASGSAKWLPGSTLTALAEGGSAELSYASALALGAAYVLLGLGLAGLVFTRRAITD
ncbi:MAG: hypothetical protein ABIP19_14150 [Dermatophilaceae bacterium]